MKLKQGLRKIIGVRVFGGGGRWKDVFTADTDLVRKALLHYMMPILATMWVLFERAKNFFATVECIIKQLGHIALFCHHRY